MSYPSVSTMLASETAALRKGPICIVIVEDDVEVATTLRHHQQIGFRALIAFMPPQFDLPPDLAQSVIRIDFETAKQGGAETAVNDLIDPLDGLWLYYCYNSEFLFYPFLESRSIVEMIAFHSEERRDAMLTYVVDLYADNLAQHPNAVSLDHAHLDRSGYYALARESAGTTSEPVERQLDFFGGLRWRYEEHVPAERRKIDRIALFKAKKGLRLRSNHTFTDEEYNTYACPWHHNITCAVCSFRTAKALKSNPGSRHAIDSFKWHNSAPFEWHSRQLLDLGLMEPGQWF